MIPSEQFTEVCTHPFAGSQVSMEHLLPKLHKIGIYWHPEVLLHTIIIKIYFLFFFFVPVDTIISAKWPVITGDGSIRAAFYGITGIIGAQTVVITVHRINWGKKNSVGKYQLIGELMHPLVFEQESMVHALLSSQVRSWYTQPALGSHESLVQSCPSSQEIRWCWHPNKLSHESWVHLFPYRESHWLSIHILAVWIPSQLMAGYKQLYAESQVSAWQALGGAHETRECVQFPL